MLVVCSVIKKEEYCCAILFNWEISSKCPPEEEAKHIFTLISYPFCALENSICIEFYFSVSKRAI